MSKSSERIAISKRERFSIFSRDGFRCKYCGKQPPNVLLVVDHVIPVSKDGTNHADNLVTSCEECNQGKSDKSLKNNEIPEDARLAIAQEQMETIRIAEATNRAIKAAQNMSQDICDYICSETGIKSVDSILLSQMVNITKEFGPEFAIDCVSILFRKFGSPTSRYDVTSWQKYLGGIARKHREESSHV